MKYLSTTLTAVALGAMVATVATVPANAPAVAPAPAIATTADVQPPASTVPPYPHLNPAPNGPSYPNLYGRHNGQPDHPPPPVDGSHNRYRPGYSNGAPNPHPVQIVGN